MPTPALPPGFVLDQPQSPALPPGFVLDGAPAASPGPPLRSNAQPQAAQHKAPQNVYDGLARIEAEIANRRAAGASFDSIYSYEKQAEHLRGQIAAWERGEPPGGFGEAMGDLAMGAADTVTLGHADEIAGVFGGDTARESARTRLDLARERNPVLNTIGSVAGAVPSMLIPMGAAIRGGSTLGRMAKGALTGGATSGAYAAGSEDGSFEDKLAAAGQGALWGGATGLAIPAVARGVGGAANWLTKRPTAAPATADLRAQAQALYDAADQAGVVISPQSQLALRNQLGTILQREGFDRYNAIPEPLRAPLQAIMLAGQAPGGRTLRQMDMLLRDLRDAGVTASEKRVATMLADEFRTYLNRLSPQDVLAGNPMAGARLLNDARALWARQAKAQTIDTIMANAQLATGANYTQAGMVTALRQQFRTLIRNRQQFAQFTPDEQAAIRQVVMGTPTENTLRTIGRIFAPTNTFGLITGAASGLATGQGWVPFATAAAGEAAKRTASRLAMNRANNVSELVRLGGQATPPGVGPGLTNLIQRMLLPMQPLPAINATQGGRGLPFRLPAPDLLAK